MTDRIKIYIWIIVFGIMIIGSIIFFVDQNKNLKIQPVAQAAIFNFKEVDFSSLKTIRLYGDVAFWWDTLISNSNKIHQKKIPPDAFVHIPDKWNDVIINNKELPTSGYATYCFKIIVPKIQAYALKMQNADCAYDIWIDGVNLGGAGILATSKKIEKPSKKRKEFFFTPTSDTIDVIIQVSNFHLYKGGLTKTILFGTAENIALNKNHMLGLEMFLFGLLFILFLYHQILYYFRRKDKSILLFSLLCLFILIRLLTTGEKYILEFFPNLPWSIEMRFEYLSLLLTAVSIGWYFHMLFPKEITLWFIRGYSFLVIPCALTIIFTQPYIFSRIISFIQLMLFSGALWVMSMNFVSIIKRREFAFIAFSGFIIFILFVTNDLLHYYKLIDTYYLSPLGLMFLVVTQVFVVSKRTSVAFVEVENLSEKLEKSNFELEERVIERTQQIEEQKEDIEQKADELNAINKRLDALMRFKRDVTNMMVHDLKNPLNNILGFSEFDGDISMYKEIIYSSGLEMQNLIRNILDVEKYGTTKLILSIKRENLSEIIENAKKVNDFLIRINDIRFENTVPKDVFIYIDKEIIERVCINIISNATKYNNHNGLIRVSTQLIEKENKKYQKIEIYNTGDQIPPEKINIIFNQFEQAHEQKGAYSYSSGIGLSYCKMAIKEHGGEISVSQDKDTGVSFWFTIPI